MPTWGIILIIAACIEAVGLYFTGRFIFPAFKRVGKPLFYLGVTLGLAYWLGWWALIFVIVHPLIGIWAHITFCKKIGMDPLKGDPQKYREAQEAAMKDFAESMKQEKKDS